MKALSWLVFPSLLALIAGLGVVLLATPLPRPAVSGLMLVLAIVVVMALERISPLHREWNTRPDRVDLFLIVFNRVVDVGVIAATVGLLSLLGPSSLALWPTQWPLLAQAALGMMLGEGVRYVFHRLSHRPGILGRVHETHHAPKRMYALNGPRLHPGNQLWLAFANIVPMLALGAELSAVVLAVSLTAFFVLFQHANIDLRFDGWNRVFATPDVHRLHHMRDVRDVNYGIVFLAFDMLFRTYRHADRVPSATDIGQ